MTDDHESNAIVPASNGSTVDAIGGVLVNTDQLTAHVVGRPSSVLLSRDAAAHYSVLIRNAFLERTGFAFQDFVVDILERRHPGDFDRVRPTGSVGDHSCDGRIRSSNTLIACYGTRQTVPAKVMIDKIESDFAGALAKWPEMKIWRFVHNDHDGLGPDVVKALDKLKADNPNITIEVWGFNELKQEALRLEEHDLIELHGYAPNGAEQVTIASLIPVIEHVGRASVPAAASVKQVPPNKVAYNELGDETQVLLAVGMRKADVVRKYFDGYHDPKLGDEVAEALRQRYEQCRDRGLAPDDIFGELQNFATGSRGLHQTAEHQTAVYAVLAFFFEECDVFEEPPEGWTP